MKSNTKKRLIAFMLCMVLVLSSATSAFADEPQNTDSQSQTEVVTEPVADEAQKIQLLKIQLLKIQLQKIQLQKIQLLKMCLLKIRLPKMCLIHLTSKYLRKKNGQYK